jgi:hypothetical protein
MAMSMSAFACGTAQPTAGSLMAPQDSGVPPSGNLDAGTAEDGGGVALQDGGSGGMTNPDAGCLSPPLPMLTCGEIAETLAVDEQFVYWVNSRLLEGRWELRALPKTGGTPVTLAAHDGKIAQGLVADADALYFDAFDCIAPCRSTQGPPVSVAWRVPKAGGNPIKVGSASGMLAVDDRNLYAVRAFTESEPAAIVPYPKMGGPPTVLVPRVDHPTALGIDDRYVYFSYTHNAPTGETFTPVERVPKTGGDAEMIGSLGTSMGDRVETLKVTPDAIFILTSDLWSIPRGGGASTLLRRGGHDDVDAAAGFVYWSQPPYTYRTMGCLGRAATDGSDAHCLLEGPYNFRAVRVDKESIYFVVGGDIGRLKLQQ